MKRIATVLATLMLVSALASVASARPNCSPRIDRREARQHVWIRQGVRQGDLTPGETQRLNAGQRHVDRMEDRARSDGSMSVRERARITRAQNHQSRRIFRMWHNGRRA